jgi:hypothetical protein
MSDQEPEVEAAGEAQHVAETAAEFEADTAADPDAETAVEPDTEATTEPDAEAAAKRHIEAAAEAAAELSAAPAAEPDAAATVEPSAESAAEPAAVATAEDATERAAENQVAPAAPDNSAIEEARAAAAVRMQKAQRGKRARLTFAQRKAARTAVREASKLEAAVTLQAVNRGVKSRRDAKARRTKTERAAMRIQASFKGHKERTDPNAETNVRRERLKLNPRVQAAQYLDHHQIVPLFEQLAQALIFAKPEDPKAFLIQKLQSFKGAGNLASPLLFFAADEIEVLYDMYDVAKRGMTVAQCAEALKALGIDAPPQLPAGARFVSKSEFKQMVTG